MNLTLLDWAIVVALLLTVAVGVLTSRRYMRSVADFLAAGRTSGRYLLSVSQGMAAVGGITIVANLEMNYQAGFAMSWWGLSTALVVMLVAVSGWVVYRFRSTRCLTMAEFFERRYSRGFRVFAGVIAFVAGIVNFGIFPFVGARFFLTFAGIPDLWDVAGLAVPSFPVVMGALIAFAYWTVFSGGHVAVTITNFVQGVFANVVFVAVPVFLLLLVGWPRVAEVLGAQPAGRSLIDPFDTGYVETFNFEFFLIGVVGIVYCTLSWQGTQAYNTSARSAHEAKMGGVLSMWRGMPQGLLMMLVPILASVVMQHPDFAGTRAAAEASLSGIGNGMVRSQMRTPVVLSELLPPGLSGMFCAMMVVACVSTHATYMHSWGSILVQDVVMPFRKAPLSPERHLRLLQRSVGGVCLFIFAFSLLYVPTEEILLYFAITGAIFAGGSGAVIVGGLYWKRGTTGAAWAAMVTGSSLAVGGIVLQHLWPRGHGGERFPVDGQWTWGIAMAASAVVYVLVSLLVRPRVFDLGKLLSRGAAAEPAERVIVTERPSLGARLLGMGREFTRRDRAVYLLTYAWTFLQIAVFAVGTAWSLAGEVPDRTWLVYWEVYVGVQVVLSAAVILWFTVGGTRDIGKMVRSLATSTRDDRDDGRVREEQAP